MSFGTQIPIIAFSFLIRSVETTLLLREPERFFVDEPGGSGGNLTSEMTRTCSFSNPIPTYSGTYPTVSSIMSVGNTISLTKSMTTLELGVEIAIHCKKITYFGLGSCK